MKNSSVGEKTYEELAQEVANLTALVTQLLSASEQKKEKAPRKPRQVKEKVVENGLSPNTYVKVMNLLNNPLNLSTRPRGKGKTFRLENFGDIKSMFYSELLEVIENHPNFFSAGYFYILDPRVIEENNYVEVYEKILTKDKMEQIFSNSTGALEMFSSANKKQQNVIIEYFVEKIQKNEPVDFNLIAGMSRTSGIDIMKRAEETKYELPK